MIFSCQTRCQGIDQGNDSFSTSLIFALFKQFATSKSITKCWGLPPHIIAKGLHPAPHFLCHCIQVIQVIETKIVVKYIHKNAKQNKPQYCCIQYPLPSIWTKIVLVAENGFKIAAELISWIKLLSIWVKTAPFVPYILSNNFFQSFAIKGEDYPKMQSPPYLMCQILHHLLLPLERELFGQTTPGKVF